MASDDRAYCFHRTEPDSPFTAALSTPAQDLLSGARTRSSASRHFPTFGNGEASTALCEPPHAYERSSSKQASDLKPPSSPRSSLAEGTTVQDSSARVLPQPVAASPAVASLPGMLDQSLWQEEEQLHRKHRASRRKHQLELEEMEDCLSEMATNARKELDKLGLIVENHQRSALALEEMLKKSMTNVSQLTTVLDGKEQQTAELGDLVTEVSQTLSRLVVKVDAETQRIEELEQRIAALLDSTSQLLETESTLAKKSQDGKSLLHALRKLENLVVRESEYRAAGIREVLEQVRSEQSKKASELEDRCKAEQQQLERRLGERLKLVEENTRRSEDLNSRLATSERVWPVECGGVAQKQPESSSSSSSAPALGGSVPAEAAAEKRGPAVAPYATQASLSETEDPRTADQEAASMQRFPMAASMSKLEALEARFDCQSLAQPQPSASLESVGSGCGSRAPLAGAAADDSLNEVRCQQEREVEVAEKRRTRGNSAIDKLRDQLAGLRSELASGLEGPWIDKADLGNGSRDIDLSSWSRDQSLLSEVAAGLSPQPSQRGKPEPSGAVGPVVSAPAVPTMARHASAPSCHSLLSQAAGPSASGSASSRPQLQSFKECPSQARFLASSAEQLTAHHVHSKAPQSLSRTHSETAIGTASVPHKPQWMEGMQATPRLEKPTLSMPPPRVGAGGLPSMARPPPQGLTASTCPPSAPTLHAQDLSQRHFGSRQIC